MLYHFSIHVNIVSAANKIYFQRILIYFVRSTQIDLFFLVRFNKSVNIIAHSIKKVLHA